LLSTLAVNCCKHLPVYLPFLPYAIKIPIVNKAEYKYNPDERAFYKRLNGDVARLGFINTNKGRLTRAQKLKLIQAHGEWVRF